MGGEYDRLLHIFFFPFMAPGHMIPTVQMAKLFASRGVRASIVSTPLNTPLISKSLGKSESNTPPNCIHIKTINFPCAESGLPGGCENVDSLTSPDMMEIFFQATTRLQEPFEKLLEEHRPDCIVADIFFPWANDSASKFGIPRLVFHGTSFFSLCATVCMRLFEPYKNVSSDTESFVISNLPGEIKMTRLQVPDFIKNKEETALTRIVKEAMESELKCYGVIVNSFYELEQVYADHYRNVLKRRSWHIGSLSLCNRDTEEKAQRGKEASIDEHECSKWLDSKEPNSVVYVCFGSIANFPETQLREIARGLEASGKHFIWVVRRGKKDEDKENGEWLPEGFEKSIEGKGLIIRSWAPQILILDHEAVGAFVTHCGWNSTLEGISAGVPMVTWPVSAEQFYNEKLVTDVLKIGVPVGAKKWVRLVGDRIKWDGVVRAVNRIMEGEEAEEMRKKAKELAQMARQAVKEGGSSYADLNALIEELGSRCH